MPTDLAIAFPLTPQTARPHISVTRKELSRQLQARYLAALEDTGFRTLACQQVKIGYFVPSVWECRSPAFKIAHQEAQERARSHTLDLLSTKAFHLAYEGWERPIYQKGQLVGKERYFATGLIESVLDRLARGTWAQSPNAININNSGPSAIQINLGGERKQLSSPVDNGA